MRQRIYYDSQGKGFLIKKGEGTLYDIQLKEDGIWLMIDMDSGKRLCLNASQVHRLSLIP